MKNYLNLIILGCGRSGTSALAGMMHYSGYNTGDNFIPVRESNPKGFFEDSKVLKINEKILFNSYPKKFPFSGEWILDFKYSTGRLWLSRLGLNAKLFFSDEIKESIKEILKNKPFCYKDPRFCYTLPLWKPYLKNTLFICIFREPQITAASLLKEYRNVENPKEYFLMDFSTAIEIWTHMYKHVLKKNDFSKEKWLFIHYNQLFTDKGLKIIEKALGIKIKKDFIDENLKRTKSSREVPKETLEIYNELCRLAKYF